MANKDNLRKQRAGTVINNTSEKREGKAAIALGKVMLYIINSIGKPPALPGDSQCLTFTEK